MKQFKQYFKTTRKVLLLTASLATSVMAMDVPSYYDVDIKSMKISIDGSKKVLLLLQSGAPLQEQYSVDDELQENLRKLFASVDSTPSKHAGFYMQHQKEVQNFYENDSTLQDQYARLKETLENINKQIKTLRGKQK